MLRLIVVAAVAVSSSVVGVPAALATSGATLTVNSWSQDQTTDYATYDLTVHGQDLNTAGICAPYCGWYVDGYYDDASGSTRVVRLGGNSNLSGSSITDGLSGARVLPAITQLKLTFYSNWDANTQATDSAVVSGQFPSPAAKITVDQWSQGHATGGATFKVRIQGLQLDRTNGVCTPYCAWTLRGYYDDSSGSTYVSQLGSGTNQTGPSITATVAASNVTLPPITKLVLTFQNNVNSSTVTTSTVVSAPFPSPAATAWVDGYSTDASHHAHIDAWFKAWTLGSMQAPCQWSTGTYCGYVVSLVNKTPTGATVVATIASDSNLRAWTLKQHVVTDVTTDGSENTLRVRVYSNDSSIAQIVADIPIAPPSVPVGQTYGTCGCGASQMHTLARNSQLTVGRADPVNTATGAFTEQRTDASLPGRGVRFDFTRSYTSLDTSSGLLGQGWSTPYDARLTVGSGGSPVTYRSGDGAQAVYTLVGGSYQSPVGVRSVLAAVTGGYQITNPDLTTETFDSSGQLTAVADANGQGLSFSYVSGQLTSITDAAGRTVGLSYNSSGLLSGLSLPGARSVGYGYTSGRLTSVTDLASQVWTYGYDSNGLLQSLTTPRGHALFTNSYSATTGRVTSQTDARGNTTSFAWNATTQTSTTTNPDTGTDADVYRGNVLISSTDPLGHATRYFYDSNLNVVATEDPTGAVVLKTYDAVGNVTSVVTPDPYDDVSTLSYNSLNEPLTSTDARGQVTTDTYDSHGNRTSITTPAGAKTIWTYNSDGTTATMVTPPGNVTGATAADYTYTYGYDSSGQLTSVTDPLGHQTTFGYDSSGRRTSLIDPRGNATGATPSDYETTQNWTTDDQPATTTLPDASTVIKTYDSDGNLASVTNQSGKTTSYGYNNADQPTTVTDARGKTTTTDYDYAGRVTSIADPNGHLTTASYDHAGRKTTTVSPRGNVTGAIAADYTTSYTYDDDNRLLTSSYPLPSSLTATSSTSYDTLGRVASTTDPNGHTTSHTYDADSNILTSTTARGETTSYSYTADNKVASVTDPNGHLTNYSYTVDDLPASRTDADNRTTSYTYDRDRQLSTSTAPGSLVTTLSYDLAGNTTGRSYSDGVTPNVSYHYDAQNRVTSMTDGTGTTSYSYTGGHLSSTTNGHGDTLAYTYNDNGQIHTVTYPATTADPSGRTVTYAYDDAGQTSSLQDWASHTTNYGYNPDGQITSINYPNGVTDTRVYDIAGRTSSSTTDTNSSTTLADFTYTYDKNSQVASAADTLNGTTTNTNYTYNADNELATSTAGTYTTDPANQLTGLANGTTQQYDNAGQLTQSALSSATTTYGYNTRGDRTSITPPSGGGAATTLAYDQANHLTSYTHGTSTASYGYDGNGLRQTATNGSTTTHYTWDPDAALPLLIDDGTSSWVYGPTGPVEQVANSTDTPTYLHSDQLGSTRLLTDATGTQAGTYTYTDYGSTSSHTGTATSPLGYTGQYTDPTSGFLNLRQRDYDPTTGQFLTIDPLVDTTSNPYNYTGNNPLNLTDPSGLCVLGGWFCPRESLQFGKGELLGLAHMGTDAIKNAVDPLRAARQMWIACSNGYQQSANATDGVARCLDNLNPIAQLRNNATSMWHAAQQGCYEAAGQYAAPVIVAVATAAAGAVGAFGEGAAATGAGGANTYIDLTSGGSIRNIGTQATHTEFADTLTSGGWTSSISKDGAVQIFKKDGAKYVLRSTNSSGYPGWTADFTPAGSTSHTLELRLGYTP